METIAVINERQLDSEVSLLSPTPLQSVDAVETPTPSPVEMVKHPLAIYRTLMMINSRTWWIGRL